MASTSSYPDPESQMGAGPGLYGNQNGGTPPAQQQHHVPTDPDLHMHEGLAQLQRSSDMIHAGGPPGQAMSALSAAHHHFQTPPRPTHSPQQMAQSVMSLEEHALYGDPNDGSRKRSKVSRACDECRRKKIRCDATSENGPEACSSCKRTGARCQFSRQPMKRGPSKGYIKELADRLNSLENQIQNPHVAGQAYDFPGENNQPLPDTQTPTHFPRKRTHSMSEGFHDPYGRPNWPGQDREMITNGQHVRQSSYSDLTLAGNLITNSNEGTLKAYYAAIHPILPILSHESSSLNRLTNCPVKLREYLFLALECCVRSISPAALPPPEISQLVQQCSEALEQAQHTLDDPDSHRQFYNNIVYCQSLLFLTVASDKPGPSSSGSTAESLGRLAGRISDLGLNDLNVIAPLREQDRDMFDDARRVFWVTFILDRLHASSRTKDTALPIHCGNVSRDDFNALGEAGYHLARAADIVGQVAFSIRSSTLPYLDHSSPFAFTGFSSSSPLMLYLNGQLARYRESLDISSLPSSAAPHLAYQYLRILVARQSLDTYSKDILAFAQDLLTNLINTPITPLHHMYAQLVAISLADLSDRVETQVEAHAVIKDMDDALSNGHITHRLPNGTGWDAAIRNLLHQKKAPTPPPTASERTSPAAHSSMAGLQHLAAAAVGERESADAKPSSSKGGNGTIPQAQEVKHDVTAAMAAASEAAAAQATAAAAQKQMQTALGGTNGGNEFDSSALVKDGF